MNVRRGPALLLASALALSACAAHDPISAQPERLPAPIAVALQEEESATTGPLAKFRKRRAMRHVRKLAADIGVRVRATRSEDRATNYIAEKLAAYGYDVNVQKYSVDGGTSHNVVARSPDAMRYALVIGAHMDSVPRSPGANDNASGVAVMLEIAKIAAHHAKARFLKFVAFGSEEYGTDGRHHVGSQVFVNRLTQRAKNRLPGMISVDMIADGKPLIVGTAGFGPDVVAKTLLRKIRDAGIAVTYRTTCDCSDNGPFERAGIPAGFAWSGTEPNYHDPSDTVANMKPWHLARTGRAIRAFVNALDGAMIRRFRHH